MKKLKKSLYSIVMLAMILGMLVHPEIIKADTATVTFGSESYSPASNEEFLVGVYIKGESVVGSYHVELKYDANRIEYLGGAESGGNGTIVLEGTGTRDQVKYMLSFKTLSGGEAYIKVNGALVNMSTSDNTEAFEVTELDYADIVISGTDTVGTIPEEKSGFETDIPHIESVILLNNKEYYMLDLATEVPENISWDYNLAQMNFLGENVTFLTTKDRDVYITYLFDESEELECYAYNTAQKMFYPCSEYLSEDGTYLYTSTSACEIWPDELTLDIVKQQNVVFAIGEDGGGEFSRLDSDGNVVEWDSQEAQQSLNEFNNKLMLILIVTVIAIFIILLFVYFTSRSRQKKERREKLERVRQKRESMTKDIQISNLDQSTQILEPIPELPKECDEEKEKPVISVKDVTMKFKVSNSNASGIKELLIQMLKKQVTYREFTALNHVSFDVYKGEVVGIIGTNGSGKSTILRIVSGALNPTEGEVIVDRRKLQLLTLGTGFDMELTARENIYLNGSLIGYTKEFIDEHYDEIVEFAELEGFMDEKVKNFSSGMVSRLGFAIATVGEASDILILDEVLSVGDEFFRKKSLKRVKEMIHGGSTVLMVSHSMGTILENCSKVVWIEKGELKMVGEPKVVCKAYQKQNENK